MPEIIPNHVPSPRTLLAWDGTAYRPITIDAAGHIQIDVLTSALPGGAATAANQVLIENLLGQIEDIRDALQSVATDRLIVRGEDQLFSLQGPTGQSRTGIVSGVNGYFDSHPGVVGLRTVITTISVRDTTSPTTKIIIYNNFDATNVSIHEEIRAFAAGDRCVWAGQTILNPTDFIRVFFIGALAGDSITIDLTGYVMTVEV